MKKSYIKIMFNLVVFLFVQAFYAQAPQGLNYQAAARDASGKLLNNQAINIRITILQGSATGTEVYAETHSKTTNTLGLFTLTIGQGTITAPGTSFSSIDWSTGVFFMQVELKIGSGSYTNMGTTQLLSVPFSLYANEAYDAKRFTLSGTTGQTLRHNGTTWVASGNLYNNGTNVGIGTTTADDAKLEIYSNSIITKPQIKLFENDADDFARLTFQNSSGMNYWTLAAKNSTNNFQERFNIYNSTSGNLLSISGTGNIGIGTEPQSRIMLNVKADDAFIGVFENKSVSTTLECKNLGSGPAGYFICNNSQYSLFAKNEGSGPAAYLDGSLQIGGDNNSEINRIQTGKANLVPICYGSVEGNGTKNNGASSTNFTVNKINTGIYEIIITGETYDKTTHCVIASLGDIGFINTYDWFNNLRINTYNISGAYADKEFSFVIYKP